MIRGGTVNVVKNSEYFFENPAKTVMSQYECASLNRQELRQGWRPEGLVDRSIYRALSGSVKVHCPSIWKFLLGHSQWPKCKEANLCMPPHPTLFTAICQRSC